MSPFYFNDSDLATTGSGLEAAPPSPPARYCTGVRNGHPCGTRLAQMNKDSVCSLCLRNQRDARIRVQGQAARAEEPHVRMPRFSKAPDALKPYRPVLCTRGCGYPTHRGNCKGSNGGVMTPVKDAPKPPERVLDSPEVSEVSAVIAGSHAVVSAAAEVMEQVGGDEAARKLRFTTTVRKERQMDVLEAEEVSVDAVPQVLKQRSPIGRMGELMLKLEALALGKALKVANRDSTHQGTTDRQVRGRAKREGMHIETRKDGTFLYCWWVKDEVQA